MARYNIGIDIGGTKMGAARVPATGTTTFENYQEAPTPKDADTFLETLVRLIEDERAASRHDDRNLLRVEGRIVRNVVPIRHQQLDGVPAGRQLQTHLRLSGAEMQVVLVGGNRLIEGRQRRIDDGVMVPGVGHGGPGRGDADAARTHAQPELAATDHLPIVRPEDIHLGTRRRG